MKIPNAPITALSSAAAAPVDRAPAAAAPGGLVTSPIASRVTDGDPAGGSGPRGTRVHARRVYPSALPLAPKVGDRIGRGFPGVELLRHVRDEFGPAVAPDAELSPATRRELGLHYLADNRAAAAEWDGGERVDWTLYLTPGAVRIGSHDPGRRERTALREVLRRDQDVSELARRPEFLEALDFVWDCMKEMEGYGGRVEPDALARLWMAADDAVLPGFMHLPADLSEYSRWLAWAECVVAIAERYPDRDLPDPAVRGRIMGLTRKSRSRMIYTMASLDTQTLIGMADNGRVPIQTLTYGRTWLAAVPTGRFCHDQMDLLWRRYEQAWGTTQTSTKYVTVERDENGKEVRKTVAKHLADGIRAGRIPMPKGVEAIEATGYVRGKVVCIWKIEFQERGAPHVHILMAEPKGRARIPQRGRRPVGADATYKHWLSETWNDVVYGSHPCESWLTNGKCANPLRPMRDDNGNPVRVKNIGKGVVVDDPDGEPVTVGCPGNHQTRIDLIDRYCAIHGLDRFADQELASAAVEKEARDHLKAGTAVDYDQTEGMTDPKRLAAYFAKHGSFAAKRYQDKVPDEWGVRDVPDPEHGGMPAEWIDHAQQGDEVVKDGDIVIGDDGNPVVRGAHGTGRIWGYKGLKKVETPISITAADAIQAARRLRAYCRANDSVVLVDEERDVRDPFTGEMATATTGRKVVIPRRPELEKTTKKARMQRAGKHAKPRLRSETVARFAGGRARLETTDVVGIAGTHYVARPPERGFRLTPDGTFAGTVVTHRTRERQYDAPRLRTVRRRAARFATGGTPSGWALVYDGERLGSVLAACLGQGPDRGQLGLAAGLDHIATETARITRKPVTPATGPMPRTRWSRPVAELRAVRDRYAERWAGLRRDDAPDNQQTNNNHMTPAVATPPCCVDCGGELALAVADVGRHVLCTPTWRAETLVDEERPLTGGSPST